LLEFRIELI